MRRVRDGRTISVDSGLSTKAPKCGGQFLRKIYPHLICNGVFKRENKTTQIPENLHEKPVMGKNPGAKREIPLTQEDYSGCSEFYYRFDSLGSDPTYRRKRSVFIVEGPRTASPLRFLPQNLPMIIVVLNGSAVNCNWLRVMRKGRGRVDW